MTENERNILKGKRVCVVGCGGLGGYAIEYLARSGVGFIRAADGDCFDVSNLERQILCTSETLGRNKAVCAKERVALIDSGIEFDAVEVFLDEGNADSIVSECDIAIDALDNIPARRILAKTCKKAGIPLVYGAISGSYAQVSLIEPQSDAIDILCPESASPVCERAYPFTPSFAASVQAAQAVSYLLGKDEPLSGKLFAIDLLTLEQDSFELG